MWIINRIGFFSVVEKPEDSKTKTVTVRARVRSDLDALRAKYLPSLGPTLDHGGTDYPFRAKAPKADFADALSRLALDIDYDNFKNEVAKKQGHGRADLYHELWDTLRKLQDPAVTATGHKSVASRTTNAWGGVLIDAQGRILLREPSNHFDGYVWTFAKGKREPGDTPEEAALREVLEKTGYHAEIVDRIPGSFPGGTGYTEYFLMRPVGKPAKFHWETASVKWVSFDEAPTYIAQTTNRTGRQRDLAVLEAAQRAYKRFLDATGLTGPSETGEAH
jgi:8-oxo-dGTP pyrophosphatase MutT (NUDIX family)